MSMDTYRFFSDPGHGWLEVPVATLRKLGIAGQISAYSYVSEDGQTAYVEEDCDLARFAAAMGWHELPSDTVHIYQPETFIRNLPRYESRYEVAA